MTKARRGSMAFRDGLKVLSTQAQIARYSFDIWWAMEGRPTRPRYSDAMNRYLSFFRYTIEAHLAYCVITLARFYDKQANTLRLTWLVERAPEAELKADVIATARARIELGLPLAGKVNVLRSSVYAHRSATIDYSAAFKKADPKIEQVREHCEHITETLNVLRRAISLPQLEPAPLAGEDTLQLLERLREPGDRGDEIPPPGKPSPRFRIRAADPAP